MGSKSCCFQHFPRHRHRKVNLVRYADDFIITGETKDVLAQQVLPLVQGFLRERGLVLSEAKTAITHIDKGFDFLGQNVRKYNGTLIIKPSKASIRAFLVKIRRIVKNSGADTAGELIMRLNPVIRGWANYHRHVVSGRTFSSVDHAIWQILWSWATKRHSNKGLQWVKRKYFPPRGRRRWVFTGVVNQRGVNREVHLFYATSVDRRRHTAIRGNANPFDPQWRPYFDQRCRRVTVVKLRPSRRAFVEA